MTQWLVDRLCSIISWIGYPLWGWRRNGVVATVQLPLTPPPPSGGDAWTFRVADLEASEAGAKVVLESDAQWYVAER